MLKQRKRPSKRLWRRRVKKSKNRVRTLIRKRAKLRLSQLTLRKFRHKFKRLRKVLVEPGQKINLIRMMSLVMAKGSDESYHSRVGGKLRPRHCRRRKSRSRLNNREENLSLLNLFLEKWKWENLSL